MCTFLKLLKEKEAVLIKLVDHLHWSGFGPGAKSKIEKEIDAVNCEIAILKKAIEVSATIDNSTTYTL